MQEEPTSSESLRFSTPAEDGLYRNAPEASGSPEPITWTAAEFIAHHKSPRWYASLGLAAALISLLVWLATKDNISAVVVIVGAGILGGYGARQPRELRYQLDVDALVVGDKVYGLAGYRSFTIDDQQATPCINLMPLKRFSPSLSIYFPPTDEEAIIDLLAMRLPIEEHQPDPIDRLMHRIRF